MTQSLSAPSLQRMARRLPAAALDLVLPPRCPACREITDGPDRFCEACWPSLSFITRPWCAVCGLPFAAEVDETAVCGACAGSRRPYATIRAALRYEGAAVPALLGFKHSGRTHLSRLMAGMMRRLLPERTPDLVVPVPLDNKRLRKRGYNQAGLLARHLAGHAGAPLGIDTLHRVKPTASTAGLSRAGRFRAARGAFAARGPLSPGAHVLLVDDVMTTGATIEAASRALGKAGAVHVDVLVFARALGTDD